MTVGATRHFESSFAIIEWLLEERQDELDDYEIAALKTYHNVLVRTSEDMWGMTPPALPEKTDSVPLSDTHDAEWYRENY